jgi:high mobility group AT-hook protein 2
VVPSDLSTPQEKKPEETDGEPAPKRKRGRPPKNPKPEGEAGATSGGEGGESSEKKKRGRPPKSATST